jgi:extracellular factor (EF) 3-hydroxypalmitic acid methyl ester biosynthesis protein
MAIATNGEVNESLVVCQNSQGVEIHATLLRLTRFAVVFEICNPTIVLRMSEVLTDFRVRVNQRTLYSGKVVVSNLVNTGMMLVCEAKLDETGLNVGLLDTNGEGCRFMSERFGSFLGEWQKLCRIVPEFKTVMADMQSFLTDLRLWLEQVEMEIRASPSSDRTQLERKVVDELAVPVVRVIDSFIDQFETIAAGLDPELEPGHRTYLRRQLHPLVLCSPFAHRTYHKPLGYAGDYEIVDMMLRPPYEGSSLFAKIINVWLLGQSPARAHRNRVTYLTGKLVEEARRLDALQKPLRVLNIGCGPAGEVQRFLREEAVCDSAQLTLLDFNEETLANLRRTLDAIKQQCHRRTGLQFVKQSVHHMLKESVRPVVRAPEQQFDYVYCAGLFDYLSDQVCKRLMNIFYHAVAPGGLLLATNVSDAVNRTRPFRYSMEYILDWHLIYRDGTKVAALAPDHAPPDSVNVITEDTGVNVFIEVRKPSHA